MTTPIRTAAAKAGNPHGVNLWAGTGHARTFEGTAMEILRSLTPSPQDEFLTTLITNVPDGTPESEVDDTRAREAIRAAELAEQGRLLRLWRPSVEPGEWRTLGLWKADSETELKGIIATLPLHK